MADAFKVLLTRTAENNQLTQQRLSLLGIESVSLPLGKLVGCNAQIPKDVDGYIITSSMVLDVLNGTNDKPDFTKPVYCVGSRTRQDALKAGFLNVNLVAENAASLSRAILEKIGDATVNLCYLAGEQRAHDFVDAFMASNIEVNIVELYRIDRITPSKHEFNEALLACHNGVQFHYSALSAQHFYTLVKKYTAENLSKSMIAFTISKKTSLAVDILLVKFVQNAKIATEASMIEAAQQLKADFESS